MSSCVLFLVQLWFDSAIIAIRIIWSAIFINCGDWNLFSKCKIMHKSAWCENVICKVRKKVLVNRRGLPRIFTRILHICIESLLFFSVSLQFCPFHRGWVQKSDCSWNRRMRVFVEIRNVMVSCFGFRLHAVITLAISTASLFLYEAFFCAFRACFLH